MYYLRFIYKTYSIPEEALSASSEASFSQSQSLSSPSPSSSSIEMIKMREETREIFPSALLKVQAVERQLPLYSSEVSCGFPSPADNYIDSMLDLNEHLITKPAATFFVKAKGDSMTGAGIFEGDLLIIDRSLTAVSGNIVLAVLNGEFTLKRLVKKGAEIWLHPENPHYKPTPISEEMEFYVWGVAIHCIHKLR